MHRVDTSTLRRLAAEADVDPRSLIRLLRGQPVRGGAGRRGRRVLEAYGFLPKEADR